MKSHFICTCVHVCVCVYVYSTVKAPAVDSPWGEVVKAAFNFIDDWLVGNCMWHKSVTANNDPIYFVML